MGAMGARVMSAGPENRYCGHCHDCGHVLQLCLNGEEWCPRCKTYRRYRSHGFAVDGDEHCPPPAASQAATEYEEMVYGRCTANARHVRGNQVTL